MPIRCSAPLPLQFFPVASSTICHLMLSIDRYDTVKRPRVLHLRKKQLIPILVALFALAAAATVSVPFLFVHPSHHNSNSNTTTTGTSDQASSPSPHPPIALIPAAQENSKRSSADLLLTATNTSSKTHQLRTNRMCTSPENELVAGWYTPFIVLHTICVFILPGMGILINHARVRKKLCALSLTARAAHGELPLPMPLLRRPTHVIIVTGMANSNLTQQMGRGNATGRAHNKERHRGGGGGSGGVGSGSAGSGPSKPGQRQVKRKPQSKRLGPHDKRRRQQQPKDDDQNDPPLDERPMIVSSSQHNNNLRATASNASNVQQNPEFPLPQTSTLIYRRRMANILMTAAFLFLVCWLPYTIAVFYYESKGRRSKIVADLGLLIGE